MLERLGILNAVKVQLRPREFIFDIEPLFLGHVDVNLLLSLRSTCRLGLRVFFSLFLGLLGVLALFIHFLSMLLLV